MSTQMNALYLILLVDHRPPLHQQLDRLEVPPHAGRHQRRDPV